MMNKYLIIIVLWYMIGLNVSTQSYQNKIVLLLRNPDPFVSATYNYNELCIKNNITVKFKKYIPKKMLYTRKRTKIFLVVTIMSHCILTNTIVAITILFNFLNKIQS